MATRNRLLETIISFLFPVGSFTGTRALTTQSYSEANSKNGTQHEASTLLSLDGSAVNNTIFVTGSLPIALKGRQINSTGIGVKGEIFSGATYSGGVDTAYQNASDINPVAGLAKIYVSATILTDGTSIFAPTYSFSSSSQTSKGFIGGTLGGERLLKPNTVYLLRLTSLDDQPQQVSSFLTWFEGELDLPLP